MPVTYRIRDDLTVHDIRELASTRLVEVTPHVGNWTPARLVQPTLGVYILCVDHTIGSKDRNAHPHLLIQGGHARTLSQHADKLTTHNHVTERASRRHRVGTSLSEVHVGAIRRLHPSAHIATHTEHLREHRELTLAVLELVTELSPSYAWWRSVDTEGGVTNFKSKHLPRTWREYRDTIFSLSCETHGWLVHNRIAILMDVIQQSRGGVESEIFHLSGPDMVRYLGSEIEVISRMYDYVRARMGLKQSDVTINLIPFANFRFATRSSQAWAAQALCEELRSTRPCQNRLRPLIDEAFDILADSTQLPYFTQHDCVESGEYIVVPDIAQSFSMAECAKYMAIVRESLEG